MNNDIAKPDIKCTAFEDNKGAEELAKVTKNRPITTCIAVKYHHFRQAAKDKHSTSPELIPKIKELTSLQKSYLTKVLKLCDKQ
eukprot:11430392-Ditylum_brightwellii.AAC.1